MFFRIEKDFCEKILKRQAKSSKEVYSVANEALASLVNFLNTNPQRMKYMVTGYLDYSNKNGKAQVATYINSLNLSK